MDILDLCRDGKSAEVLELLKCPDDCKIDQVDGEDGTALMWACCKSMTDVVPELLKHPNECKIDKVNKRSS